jgi:hypothetical protein
MNKAGSSTSGMQRIVRARVWATVSRGHGRRHGLGMIRFTRSSATFCTWSRAIGDFTGSSHQPSATVLRRDLGNFPLPVCAPAIRGQSNNPDCSAASIDRGRRLMPALIQRCLRVPSDSVDDDATATSAFKRLVVLRARPGMWKSAIAGDHTQVSVNVSPQNVLDLVIAGLRSVSAVVIYWWGASKPRRERLMSRFRSRFLLGERLVPFRLGSNYAETDAALLSRTIVGY